MNKKVQKALNDQINAELYSAYLYLAMAAFFAARNLNGFAHWMQLQAKEEVEHAMKFYGFIFDRRGEVTLDAIKKPTGTWKTPLDAFEAAFKHEQFVTGRIEDLVALAAGEKDPATSIFLQWFVSEQVEEEAIADSICQNLRMVKDHAPGLFMIDRELGMRKE